MAIRGPVSGLETAIDRGEGGQLEDVLAMGETRESVPLLDDVLECLPPCCPLKDEPA
jgi:hypothetical protein